MAKLKWLIIVAVAIVLIFIGFSAVMSRRLSFPNGLTLEDEKKWEIEHGVWGELEKYRSETYTVKGKDDYVLHCEKISSDDTKNTRKYVIISHGYNSNRYGAGKYVPIYLKRGYNCIIYDLRGHGENEKTVCTIGNFEAQDLTKIIEDTYERWGNDIYLGLHGESMGSSTSLSSLKYNPKIHFVVADCGFTNLYELIGTGFKKSHLDFTEPCVDMCNRLLYGWSMKNTNAIEAVRGSKIPICFIHGSADDFILPENSKKLKNAASGYTELHFVDGAGHAESRAVLGEEAYGKIIDDFLDQVYKSGK